MALQYAKDRKQFTKPVGTFQAIAHMLADMQRHYRDARAATIAAGTSQIQRNLIAGLMGLKV